MKLQIEAQSMRFRISEAELERLLAGHVVQDATELPGGRCMLRHLSLIEAHGPTLLWQDSNLELRLPRDAVAAYAQTLPRRDALPFAVAAGQSLAIAFEVDVRDSMRTRRPGLGKRSAM